MACAYLNPPLIEAICELRFEPSQPWDWTIPGLIYAELRHDFPKRKEQRALGIEVQEGPQELRHRVHRQVDRMQFLRQDEKALVQVGRDILAVNHLRPYPSWPEFRRLITRALEIYHAVAAPTGYRRISLRYINRIEIPEDGPFEIQKYLKALPQVPDSLPQSFAGWALRTDIPFEQINGVLTLQSGSVLDSPLPGKSVFLLDLDFAVLDPELVAIHEAIPWVDQAHDAVETAFEACITEATRSLFQETPDAHPA